MAGPLNPVPEAGDSHPGLLKPSQVEVPPPPAWALEGIPLLQMVTLRLTETQEPSQSPGFGIID